MSEDDIPPVEDGTDELLTAAADVESKGSITARMQEENQILSTAVDYVAGWSQVGDISNANANALADALSSEFAHYTKTDIKEEFSNVFVDTGGDEDGVPFDEVIENRLDEVKIITTSDSKKGLVWRWHFTDGVQLETQTSKDGQRKHFDWPGWKDDYFEALLSLGQRERIAPPKKDLRDSAAWKDWLSNLVLERAETVQHVGPRTEAVNLLKDFVNRQTAYADMDDMCDRQGIWMDAPPVDEESEAVTDGGGPSEIRVPTRIVKRICDQAGIETRAFQIELDARELTVPDTAGVSGFEYADGQRISFWSLDADFADPAEFVEEPDTPAEMVAHEQEEAVDEGRTSVGAVDGDETTEEDGDDKEPETSDVTDEPDAHDSSNDFETGITDEFGVDPADSPDDDEGGE